MINRRRTYGELSPKDIIMTSESNPEVLSICYAQGWAKHADYMTAREAAKVKNLGTAFQNSNIQHFNELLYFTGTGKYLTTNSTFFGCSSLLEITIPANITRFYGRDFGGCTSLKKVNVINLDNLLNNMYTYVVTSGCPTYNGADLYYNGQLVEEVTIVKNPVRYTLINCKSVKRIIVSEGVTTIGDLCFYGCSNVTSVSLPSTLRSFGGESVFRGTAISSIIIPEGVSIITTRCFTDCKQLSSVTIPSTITRIDENAFSGIASNGGVYISDLDAWCRINFNSSNLNMTSPTTSLKHLYLNGQEVTSVIVPNDVTSLKFNFSYLRNLTNATLPEGLTTIGGGTFDNCTSLVLCDIPSTVTSIGIFAFRNCTNLLSVSLPSGLTSIALGAFLTCNKIESSITIPATCTAIGSDVFRDCQKIPSIAILGIIPTINEGAFLNCKLITLLILPEGVATVTGLWIWGCKNLTYVEFPSTITNITGLGLITYSPNKTTIVIKAVTPPGNPSASYAGVSIKGIYVPDESVDLYKLTWTGLSSYIHAMSELPE